MGFFGCGCMLTGVELNSGGTVAVSLRQTPGRYEPVAHGISGTYDRGGTIDAVREDRGTDYLSEQFGPDDVVEFRAEAGRDYQGDPAVLAGLDAYAVHLQEWIDLEGQVAGPRSACGGHRLWPTDLRWGRRAHSDDGQAGNGEAHQGVPQTAGRVAVVGDTVDGAEVRR